MKIDYIIHILTCAFCGALIGHGIGSSQTYYIWIGIMSLIISFRILFKDFGDIK